MTIAELIEALKEFDPNLKVVCPGGLMGYPEEVTMVYTGQPGEIAYTVMVDRIPDGTWVQLM